MTSIMRDHKRNIKKLCRICLFNQNYYNNNNEERSEACNYQSDDGECPKMFSIHKTMIGKYLVRELISNVTKMKITEGDGYPENVCESCLEKLRVANYIHMQCLTTHTLLRESFRPKIQGQSNKSSRQSFTCAHCNCNFKNRMNLLNHIRSHIDRKFTCQYCGVQFIRSDHLKCHIDVKHCDQVRRNFKCDLCPFESYLKQNLRVHMRVHSTKKQLFKCDYCEKSYTYHCDLKRHVFQHENNSPYRCEICDKSFYSKSNLKVHQKIHQGLKEFKCRECNQRFSQNVCLLNHVKALHGNEGN